MNLIPCGKILDEGNRLYHSRDCISSSKAKLYMQSAMRFHRTVILKNLKPKKSDALDFGAAFHALMESEAELAAISAINPYESFRTDSAKAWKATMEAQGKLILTKADVDALYEMQRNVMAHPTASKLLAFAPEKEVTWRAKMGRFYVQARTDRWSESGCELTGGMPYFVDYKLTPTLLDDAFVKEAAKFDYAFQMEFYRQVIASVSGATIPPRAFLVVVENEPPYEVEIFEIDEQSQIAAKAQVLLAMRDMRRSFDEDLWPGRPTGISILNTPIWKVKKIENKAIAAAEQAKALTS